MTRSSNTAFTFGMTRRALGPEELQRRLIKFGVGVCRSEILQAIRVYYLFQSDTFVIAMTEL